MLPEFVIVKIINILIKFNNKNISHKKCSQSLVHTKLILFYTTM